MLHTFAVSAYGTSPYLEECIRSLKDQSAESGVIICTSTPDPYIDSLALKYAVPVYVRDGRSSLAADWNFAMRRAAEICGSSLVTVAHQDDIYAPGYSAALLDAYGRYPDMSLFCTRYRTIGADGRAISGKSESVKRKLRLLLRLRAFADRRFIKRSALIFGNSICCPSCTYNIGLTGLPVFDGEDRFVTDWKALLKLADRPGRFVCVEEELLSYRVHDGAATRKTIDEHIREKEELEVYSSIWPAPAAALLSRLMRASYSAYTDIG